MVLYVLAPRAAYSAEEQASAGSNPAARKAVRALEALVQVARAAVRAQAARAAVRAQAEQLELAQPVLVLVPVLVLPVLVLPEQQLALQA